jgi:hypothetical protein
MWKQTIVGGSGSGSGSVGGESPSQFAASQQLMSEVAMKANSKDEGERECSTLRLRDTMMRSG